MRGRINKESDTMNTKFEMINDEFLSEEDLDLQNLTEEELYYYWDLWLKQAQITNDLDKHTYSHGVFTLDEITR